MTERYRDRWYKWKVLGCYIWGLPFAAVGVLLCATIVFAPVGLLAFTVAGAPLARQQRKHMERKRAWINRDQPMPGQGIPPWLLNPSTGSDSVLEFEIDRVEPDA